MKSLWKYLILVVIHDTRVVSPLGKWRTLIDLVWARKEYSFMYSKMLRPSQTSNEFVYEFDDRQCNVYELIKMHQYEMTLPISSILAFRYYNYHYTNDSYYNTCTNYDTYYTGRQLLRSPLWFKSS